MLQVITSTLNLINSNSTQNMDYNIQDLTGGIGTLILTLMNYTQTHIDIQG